MSDGTVQTPKGSIRGAVAEGIWSFLGIPYAKPPIGRLRFRPPEPVDPWQGVRDATTFGPIAPQPNSGLGSYLPGDSMDQSEDCLSLNVWTPSTSGEQLPVMVFIHGGAYLIGSGSQVMYRGEHLARRGVVVVTINYRLGVLGFLAHPVLYDEKSEGFGNWGLLDQIAAFAWVKENVAAFGGDPGKVTAFGESAGAMSLCELLGAPLARGMFQRAIIESGSPLATYADASSSVAERFANCLGLDELTREGLEDVPLALLLEAQRAVSDSIDGGIGLPFRPVVDGGQLKRHPADEIADGGARSVDLLIGTNRDEFKFFSAITPQLSSIDDAGLCGLIDRYLRASGIDESKIDAAALIQHYRTWRSARDQTAGSRDLLDAIVGDWLFRIPAMRLAEAFTSHNPNTYVYVFDWESPFGGGVLGACHVLELPFVFGTLRNPVIGFFAGSDERAFALSDTMANAWVAFATNGDPSHKGIGSWPRYSPDRRATFRFGAECRVEDDPYAPERNFWEAILGRYGVGGPIEGVRARSVALLSPHENEHAGT